MASRNLLLRNGASLLNRLSLSNSKSLLQQPLNSNFPHPSLFPSLTRVQSFPQNDAESVKKLLSPEGFLYPCGDTSSSEEPILFQKPTYNPSVIKRKRTHGFFARKATKGGRKVIA